MLIFGYVRQSSAEQVRFGYNLEEQERQIRDYCELHYSDDKYELKVYIDAGKSGTNMNRPELQNLLKDSKKEKPNVVIFHNIDRLSRELSDLWTMIKFFNKNNIKLVSVVSYIDLNSAYGTGNVLNEGLSAMIESMKISDRTIRAYKEAVKQGKYPFSGCPKGFKKVDKHLYPSDNPKDIELINYIFTYIAENKGNIPTLRKELINKYNFKITDYNISRLIKNTIYIGKIEYKDITIDEYCEPIVSKQLFVKANNNVIRKKHSHTKTIYYFKNKVYCCNCNCYMYQTAGTSKQRKLYAYYKCPKCDKYISQIKLIDSLSPDLNNLTKRYFEDKSGYTEIINKINVNREEQLKLVEKQKNNAINVDDFYSIYHSYQNKITKLEAKALNYKYTYSTFNELGESAKREVVNTYVKLVNIKCNNKGFTATIVDKNP